MATGSDLDKVRAELICSICLDLLNEPKKLDCDHSFCQKCLEIHVHQHTPIPPHPADDPREPKGRVVICACCRQETNLPENGVEGLKTNFKLKSLVEILSTQEREQTLQSLGKGHHQRIGQIVPTCKEQGHERESCVFFCQDCNKLFCRYCLYDHSQHKWDNYDTVLLQYKEEIRGSIQPAYEAAQSAYNAMQELEKDKDAVVQNRDSVQGKVREYFSQLAAELERRENTIMKMADRYAEVKMEQLQKHCTQLKKGHMALLQNIQTIEGQMQEDSIELLTGKDSIKTKMIAHRNTIRAALPKTEDVDTFIELKVESQVPVDTLGHLVFCQRNPCTGLVSTVRKFVESTDMDHIHLDLARPSDPAIEVPAYMQFRYALPPPTDDDTYEELSSRPLDPATTTATAGHSRNVPLPPVPAEQGAAEASVAREEDLYSKVGDESGDVTDFSRKRLESGGSEEDPYDTIPAFRHQSMTTSPSSQTSGSKPTFSTMPRELSAPTRPNLMQPLQVIDLRNKDVQPSGISCTHGFGNLVITDTNNQCLQILDKGEVFHTIGPPDVNFKKPVALAINSTNDIFVLDQSTKTVYTVRLNGNLIFSFSTKPRRGPEKPWDIAISPDDTVYISDWSRKRVYVYDGKTGNKIRSIRGCYIYQSEKKDAFVRFLRPAGIAFDRGGRLMITDRGERCVWCINTEGDELIKKIGEGHLQNPYGIAVSHDGKIFVTESESDCVSAFSEDGELLHYFGGTGLREGLLCRPHHVFVDDNMKIYVADTQNKRVQIFALPEETRVYENLHLV